MHIGLFYLFITVQKQVHEIYHKLWHHNIQYDLIVQNDCYRRMQGMHILKTYEYTLQMHTNTPSSITCRIPITPFFCLSNFIICVWSLQIMHIHISQLCHFFVLHLSRGALVIQLHFVKFLPIIGAASFICIMKP